jgi:hypothetical protein
VYGRNLFFGSTTGSGCGQAPQTGCISAAPSGGTAGLGGGPTGLGEPAGGTVVAIAAAGAGAGAATAGAGVGVAIAVAAAAAVATTGGLAAVAAVAAAVAAAAASAVVSAVAVAAVVAAASPRGLRFAVGFGWGEGPARWRSAEPAGVVVTVAAGPGVSVSGRTIDVHGGRRLCISAMISNSRCVCDMVCDMPAATASALRGCRVGAGAAIAVVEAAATAVAVAAGQGGEAAGWRGFRFDMWVRMGNALDTRNGGTGRMQAQEMFWIKLRNHAVLRIAGMCVSKSDSPQLFFTNP